MRALSFDFRLRLRRQLRVHAITNSASPPKIYALGATRDYWEGQLHYNAQRGNGRTRAILLGATILASAISTAAFAQAQPTAPSGAAPATGAKAGQPQALEKIVVTGFRKSLTAEAISKRTATNNTDSVFAEDIGKFPDLNIAESLQR